MIVGMDEVGRGCWAGPLVVGAVVLTARPPGTVKLADSKVLSKIQRVIAADWINAHALAVSLGWVEPAEIDALGLSKATMLAYERARATLAVPYRGIIIDGNVNYLPGVPDVEVVVKADATVPAVSAASIVAKVTRDNYMTEVAKQYEGYGFERHVGYGTAAHLAALHAFGVTELHRRSYKPVQAVLQAASA